MTTIRNDIFTHKKEEWKMMLKNLSQHVKSLHLPEDYLRSFSAQKKEITDKILTCSAARAGLYIEINQDLERLKLEVKQLEQKKFSPRVREIIHQSVNPAEVNISKPTPERLSFFNKLVARVKHHAPKEIEMPSFTPEKR